ncbi:hypothetical protein GDO81_005485 [Engystomops pustulosus]|uniref:Uncharacterized protein n=1 Tax=Engystomops pustulosus TaxID=76066 RepID=A0AAV7CRU4_ENGPU|nr:hypothetical protein GDO81_005485 [Engystomops pustulosus]
MVTSLVGTVSAFVRIMKPILELPRPMVLKQRPVKKPEKGGIQKVIAKASYRCVALRDRKCLDVLYLSGEQ